MQVQVTMPSVFNQAQPYPAADPMDLYGTYFWEDMDRVVRFMEQVNETFA